jgi:putative hydrolase
MAAATAESLPTQVPEELRAMAGPLLGVVGQMSGVMFGAQVGQGLGGLAREVLSSTDVGVPLTDSGTIALLPSNIEEFGKGLGLPDDQVMIYLGLREAAHVRLFTHAPWLAARIEAAIAEYSRGISVDVSGIETALGGIDPSNPQALAELTASGVFEPPTTPEQQGALDRLEAILALVEGWTDEVTWQACGSRLPSAGALRETIRRRRAGGGPAERTFETLVGLNLRPRRLQDAAELWRLLADEGGIAGRDHVWEHPDLLPSGDDLDDPAAFITGRTSGTDWNIADLEKPADDDTDQ